MSNRKRFETGDQSGSNDNSEEPKGSENHSIVNSNRLIIVKLDHKFSINHQLIIDNLPGKPLPVYDNAWLNRKQIVSHYLTKTGIYLWHNLVNSKQYVGSGYK